METVSRNDQPILAQILKLEQRKYGRLPNNKHRTKHFKATGDELKDKTKDCRSASGCNTSANYNNAKSWSEQIMVHLILNVRFHSCSFQLKMASNQHTPNGEKIQNSTFRLCIYTHTWPLAKRSLMPGRPSPVLLGHRFLHGIHKVRCLRSGPLGACGKKIKVYCKTFSVTQRLNMIIFCACVCVKLPW